MSEQFSRTARLIGAANIEKLAHSHVCLFGVGGVGGYVAEALARSGVGYIDLVDHDQICLSNINRQIIALNSTVGMYKTELFEIRLRDINPDIKLHLINDFYLEDFDFSGINYTADAIDTMRSKVNLLVKCLENNVRVISSMGAGNRINPEKLYISDISEIHDKKAPFVSNIIYQLKKKGITSGITVVTSDEKPFVQEKISEIENIRTQSGEVVQFNKIIPSSTPFVASCAGIFMASKIINDLIGR